MAQYFDEDFFKFLLGFIAIISISLIMIMATRMYLMEPEMPSDTVAILL